MLDTPTRTDRVGLPFLAYYQPHNVFHCGVDRNWGPYGNSDFGQPVIPHTWGIVEYVSPDSYNGGLGLYLVLHYPHLNRWARFLHLDKILVKVGDKTPPKQAIAHLGSSGTVSSHLHEEILNEAGRDFIRDFSRPYGRYPSGQSKQFVAARWEDPDLFIRFNNHPVPGPDLEQKVRQAQNALKYAKGSRLFALTRAIERIQKLLRRA